jgi:hypothetical protein
MPADRLGSLELDGLVLDARAIVLGAPALEGAPPSPAPRPAIPAVLWEGSVQGDGTGPQPSYYVRLYADGTATCQCPAFYFRGTLKRDQTFACIGNAPRVRMVAFSAVVDTAGAQGPSDHVQACRRCC